MFEHGDERPEVAKEWKTRQVGELAEPTQCDYCTSNSITANVLLRCYMETENGGKKGMKNSGKTVSVTIMQRNSL